MRLDGEAVYLSDLSSDKPAVPPLSLDGDAASSSHLTAAELAELRQSLLKRRQRLVAEIARLQDEACRLADAGQWAVDSSHPARGITGGAAVWERAMRLSSIADKRAILHEIDRALARIENNTYGRCTRTNRAIPVSRLREIPWARTT